MPCTASTIIRVTTASRVLLVNVFMGDSFIVRKIEYRLPGDRVTAASRIRARRCDPGLRIVNDHRGRRERSPFALHPYLVALLRQLLDGFRTHSRFDVE